MILRRVGPLSVAKMSAALYAILGFVFGAFLSLISVVGGLVDSGQEGAPFARLFGIGAIIWLPLFYATIGFLGSLIMAALYNAIAGWVGGIRLELDAVPPQDQMR